MHLTTIAGEPISDLLRFVSEYFSNRGVYRSGTLRTFFRDLCDLWPDLATLIYLVWQRWSNNIHPLYVCGSIFLTWRELLWAFLLFLRIVSFRAFDDRFANLDMPIGPRDSLGEESLPSSYWSILCSLFLSQSICLKHLNTNTPAVPPKLDKL